MKSNKMNDILMIKITKDLKEKIKEKAIQKAKNISEYVRDLIVKDLEG